MTRRFCGQCGTEVTVGSSFCKTCGAAQKPLPQQPHTDNLQSSRDQFPQQQVYQPIPQAYERPNLPGQPRGSNVPPVTSAKATGLIFAIFSLVIVAKLIVLVLFIPSKEDFSLLSAESREQTSEYIAPPQSSISD